jgi:hypothetical protein
MDQRRSRRTNIRPWWIGMAAAGVITLLLLGVPLVSLLYVGVVLLCPLMMAGMHGGHGRHGWGHENGSNERRGDDHNAHHIPTPPEDRSSLNGGPS